MTAERRNLPDLMRGTRVTFVGGRYATDDLDTEWQGEVRSGPIFGGGTVWWTVGWPGAAAGVMVPLENLRPQHTG